MRDEMYGSVGIAESHCSRVTTAELQSRRKRQAVCLIPVAKARIGDHNSGTPSTNNLWRSRHHRFPPTASPIKSVLLTPSLMSEVLTRERSVKTPR